MSKPKETLVHWPDADASFEDQAKALKQAIEVVPEVLIVPEDKRFETALATIATGGGQDAGVLARGERGSGKTAFGYAMFGEENITEVDRDSTKPLFYGYRIPGVLEEAYEEGVLTPGITGPLRTFFGNELSHLKKTGLLHELYDKEFIVLNGKKIYIGNIALYATTNFADGNRVSILDTAIMSRQAMEFLSGAMTLDLYYRLHSDEPTAYNPKNITPLMAGPEVRDSLNAGYSEQIKVDSTFGKYYVDLMKSLEDSGLTQGISLGDKRASQGYINVARGRIIADGQETRNVVDNTGRPILDRNGKQKVTYATIGPREAANVAGLVLPTQVNLSNNALSLLVEAKGETEAVTDFEQAVALREVVTRYAYETYCQMTDTEVDPNARDTFIRDYSYGATYNVNVDIEEALFPKDGVDQERAEDLTRLRRIKNGLRIKRGTTE